MTTERETLTPLEFSALSTSEFVLGHVKPGRRLLDVGFGQASILSNLAKGGLNVIGVEKDQDKVEAALKLGLDVVHADFKTLGADQFEPFDAILFSRVLHHMEPLRHTVGNILKLLKGDGLILVEDFCYERVDARTCSWLFPIARMLAEKHNDNGHHAWLTSLDLLSCESPEAFVQEALSTWQVHHEEKHHIAPFEHIKSVMSDEFDFLFEQRVPYLFRYLCDLLPDTADGGTTARQLAHWEAALAETGAIAPIGIRLVATRPSEEEV
jgi:SAM-dependent methyltransferase